MPRKTRKEKFAAHLNKQRQEEPVSIKLPAQEKQKKILFAESDNTKTYFLHDLRKSLIIISSIIVIEFALYILNMSGMLTNVNF